MQNPVSHADHFLIRTNGRQFTKQSHYLLPHLNLNAKLSAAYTNMHHSFCAKASQSISRSSLAAKASSITVTHETTQGEDADSRFAAYDYEPSVWGDYFISYSPSSQQKLDEWIEQRATKLKEEVRNMLRFTTDVVEITNIVNTIERLGIDYHFEKEINNALHYISSIKLDTQDLHHVAVRFRLLRQHGFTISSDEFSRFKDNWGYFDIEKCGDARGLLSLYNAGFLAIPGENVLDEAILFARAHLMSRVEDLKCPLKNQVLRTLRIPLHKIVPRVEARFFIEEYEEDVNKNDILLELAKLDYNLVQRLHLTELKEISLWWKELNITENLKLYARDRLIECYAFWGIGVYFEPRFSRARKLLAKFNALIAVVDDTFDIYGTFEECKLLNDAIQRWDEKAAECLPMYLRNLYVGFINTIKSFEDELEPCEKYRISHFIESIKLVSNNGYMKEVEWRDKGYVPSYDESKRALSDTNAHCFIALAAFVGLEAQVLSEEAFLWVVNMPDAIQDCIRIGRSMDDVVGFQRETEAGQDITTIKCYMIENKLSKEEAAARYQFFIEESWRRLNQACLRPTNGPMPLLYRILNYSRVMEVMYKFVDDGFNKGSHLKELIADLLLKPFPLTYSTIERTHR